MESHKMTPSNEMPLVIWLDSADKSDDCVYTAQWRPECVKYTRASPDKVMIDKKELERVREAIKYARYDVVMDWLEAAMMGEK